VVRSKDVKMKDKIEFRFTQSPQALKIFNHETQVKRTYRKTSKIMGVLGKHIDSEEKYYRVALSAINISDLQPNDKIFNRILDFNISEFPENLVITTRIKFNEKIKCTNFEIIKNNGRCFITCSRSHNIKNWTNPFSPNQLNEYLIQNFHSDKSTLSFHSHIAISIIGSIDSNNKEITIRDKIIELSDSLSSFYEDSINTLKHDVSENEFIRFFDFPPEYKNICSQYLIWFGEFLRNLGINANVSTEHKSAQTALIVSPEENGELLGKIEELFYQYIELPYMEYIPYNANKMNTHQKYQMDSLLDEIGDYQHKLKKAMRNQRLLEAENDGLLEEKIKLKTTVKELEKDKLLLKSSLKDPKKNEIFSFFNKKFSIVGSVDNKNELTVGLGFEMKPKGMIKELFKNNDKSEKTDNEDNTESE
jgi:hypothetical protein